MEAKRKVDFRILFSLIKSRAPFSIIGFTFTVMTILVFIPMMIIFSSTFKKPFERYDFKEIENKGIEKTATITGVEVLANVSDNGRNPKIITYTYNDNGKQLTDKFETIDLDKVADLNEGKEIKIFSYQDQSIIKGIAPYSFPIEIFYLFPVVFGSIGVMFLLIALIPSLKTYTLYKYGIIKEAFIISVQSGSSYFPVGIFRNNAIVNYYFLDDLKNKVFGDSSTRDILFMNGLKPGDPIKIFVSEQDTSRSCLVPNLEAMKYNWSI